MLKTDRSLQNVQAQTLPTLRATNYSESAAGLGLATRGARLALGLGASPSAGFTTLAFAVLVFVATAATFLATFLALARGARGALGAASA